MTPHRETLRPDAHWYVVCTHIHAEARAAQHLRRQGFTVYLPRFQKRRKHARKIEIVAAPLFPRYLFVSIDIGAQRWRSVQGTLGVSHMICHGNDPVPVPNAVIAAVRAREDERGFVTLDKAPRFAAGDKVRVCDGAFADCAGLFEETVDHARVSILLDLLGRKVRVMLDAEALEAA